MTDLGIRIKEARKRKGISQDELAELSGVNLRTIQRIENNENKPRIKTLILICDVLDIDRNEIEINENKFDKKLLVLPVILLSIVIISSFLSWFSFKATTGSIGKILTTTGWNGNLSFYKIKIYNWLVSLCSISIGIILILTLLNIIKKQFKIIIVQLIIVSFYVFIYIKLSIEFHSVNLKYGLFLIIFSTIGLAIIYAKIKSKFD